MVANCMAWSLKIPDKLVDVYIHLALNQSARQGCSISVEDIDLRVTRQEGPGYSYGRCQKPGAKLEDDGPEMG